MKILFLANHFNAGGITTYLLTLTRAFTGSGHQVIVASSGGNMVADLEASGAHHVLFPFNVKCEVHPGLFALAPRLAALVRNEQVDIIHAQTRVTQMCAALASGLSRVPFVSTCHGFFRPHLGRRIMPLWGAKVIAVSAPVREHLIRDFHLSVDRIASIANGIDLERFVPPEEEARRALRTQWGLASEPTLGIIARLSDVKGHEFLIQAMPLILAQFPDAKCLIFGDGPMEEDLKAEVRRNGLENNIRFYPVVNKTAEVLPLLDVFVMPSLQEGLGLSVLEAAAMSIPAVVSRVGGLPEVVRDNVTGFLVPSRDPLALARAVIILFADISRARAMGAKAREFAAAHFSAAPMADRTMGLYRSVTGKS